MNPRPQVTDPLTLLSSQLSTGTASHTKYLRLYIVHLLRHSLIVIIVSSWARHPVPRVLFILSLVHSSRYATLSVASARHRFNRNLTRPPTASV